MVKEEIDDNNVILHVSMFRYDRSLHDEIFNRCKHYPTPDYFNIWVITYLKCIFIFYMSSFKIATKQNTKNAFYLLSYNLLN